MKFANPDKHLGGSGLCSEAAGFRSAGGTASLVPVASAVAPGGNKLYPSEAVDMGLPLRFPMGSRLPGCLRGGFRGPLGPAGASYRINQGAHRAPQAFWGLLRDCSQLFGSSTSGASAEQKHTGAEHKALLRWCLEVI